MKQLIITALMAASFGMAQTPPAAQTNYVPWPTCNQPWPKPQPPDCTGEIKTFARYQPTPKHKHRLHKWQIIGIEVGAGLAAGLIAQHMQQGAAAQPLSVTIFGPTPGQLSVGAPIVPTPVSVPAAAFVPAKPTCHLCAGPGFVPVQR